MNIVGLACIFCLSAMAHAAGDMGIDVTLSPAGHFTAKSHQVTGNAYKTADGGVAAENVVIDLRNLTTDVSLRDKHTKEHLMVDKYPVAKLIKASGKNGKGTAELEVKGKKVTVAGTYKIEGGNMVAEFPMKLSQIDITGVSYMSIGVKDQVLVHINLPLGPARAAASTATAHH